MEKNIIFQLLSCLYLYDSSIPVPVCIRKQSLYTDFWQLALIHRAVGIPTSGACVNIPCRRYTYFWRRREVCSKSVCRPLASKELTLRTSHAGIPVLRKNFPVASHAGIPTLRKLSCGVHASIPAHGMSTPGVARYVNARRCTPVYWLCFLKRTGTRMPES